MRLLQGIVSESISQKRRCFLSLIRFGQEICVKDGCVMEDAVCVFVREVCTERQETDKSTQFKSHRHFLNPIFTSCVFKAHAAAAVKLRAQSKTPSTDNRKQSK